MAPRGIQEFYYARQIPSRAVAIAQVAASQATPNDLVDVVNTPHLQGSLGIWKASGTLATDPDFTAPDVNQSVLISGDINYLVQNQFFQITNRFAVDGTPLYCAHSFGQNVAGATILDAQNNVVTAPVLVLGSQMFHDMPASDPSGGAYQVRYVDAANTVQVVLLQYAPVLLTNLYSTSPTTYLFTSQLLQVANRLAYAVRFTAQNGFQALVPYIAPSYLPWYPRVRFALTAPAPEYMTQIFTPMRPYQMGSWVPGKILSSHLVEFDRKHIYTDARKPYPDIVVFDSTNAIKYALDGSAPDTPQGVAQPTYRGTLYPWKRQQIQDFDSVNARVKVLPALDPTDIVYAFYSYEEPDVLYTALDVNPVTNPAVKNCSIKFYYRTDSDPFRVIYHQIFDSAGNAVAGQTNDPVPPNWVTTSPLVFGQMVAGAAFGTSSFTVTDARVRGGGLAPRYQSIPEADNFWDLGYLDGRPYPIGAALVVYLPTSILDSMTRSVVAAKVNSVLPMGTIAVVRYYAPDGTESI